LFNSSIADALKWYDFSVIAALLIRLELSVNRDKDGIGRQAQDAWRDLITMGDGEIGHHERFAKIWQAFSEPLPTYKTCSTTFVTSHESRRATRAIRQYRCRTDKPECVWHILPRSGRAHTRRSWSARCSSESNGAVRQIGQRPRVHTTPECGLVPAASRMSF
jgi:hypothetical protein